MTTRRAPQCPHPADIGLAYARYVRARIERDIAIDGDRYGVGKIRAVARELQAAETAWREIEAMVEAQCAFAAATGLPIDVARRPAARGRLRLVKGDA